MAQTSIDIPQLKFNKMSTAKYNELKEAGQLVENEFYITPDGGTIPEVNTNTKYQVLSNDGTNLNWRNEQSPSFPSNKFINLTLGASGTTYTAPANGWFFVSKKSTAATQEFVFENKSAANFSASQESVTANRTIRVTISVKKGNKIYSYYTLGGSTEYFRFIYAEGEN